MKKVLWMALGGLTLWLPLACNQKFPLIPSSGTPVPTATFTSTFTPVCYFSGSGMAGAALPGGANLGSAAQTNPAGGAPFVIIRSQADWDALYGSSTPPAPPVSFSADMLIIVSNAVCCPSETTSIAQVCEGSSGVSITVSEISPSAQCYVVCPGSILSAVAVPNSNLPVTWSVSTNPFPISVLNVTPVALNLSTPTPSPTP